MHADYAGKGVDQLAQVIHTIKTNPESRRIVMTAWNPADLSKMVLPPCHMFMQFYVANGELSCQVRCIFANCALFEHCCNACISTVSLVCACLRLFALVCVAL